MDQSDKQQAKMMFIILGFILVPVFAEIYSYVSSFIIGGIAEIIFGQKIAGFIYTITIIASIICSIGTYIYLYRVYMRNSNNEK